MIGKRSYITPEIPSGVKEAYQKLIFHLLSIHETESPKIIKLSANALNQIADYFEKNEQYVLQRGQDISDWEGKYIGNILRIAALIHIAQYGENITEISSETLQNAIRIGEYFQAQAHYAYSLMGTDIDLKKAFLS